MKLSITVMSLCFVPVVLGKILNQGGDTLQVHSKAILDLQLRLSTVEHLRNEDALRIADLAKWQQFDQRRIADLEKQQQFDRSRISDLVNKRDEDNRTIADFEKKRQRSADLEKKRQNDRQRIADLEKQQRVFQRRIADLEKNPRDGDQRRLTYPQKQELRKNLDSHQKFPFNSLTNSTTRMVDGRRMPSLRKLRRFGPSPRNSELPSPTLETSDRGIKKRVSSENERMVAFSAALSHDYSSLTNLMEIHFDHVITNIGGSYSGNTGTFTCTHAGVYVFSWTVHAHLRYMYTELVKNGVVVGNAFSGDSQYSGTGGGSLVVQLDQGDEVWVRVSEHYSGTHIIGSRGTTMFSGFLLQ
ncbi:paramyosin-like [Mizuhopecten yessoensis]|uniref:Caprin-2 n=1 Tax=Mizuhopecten yessoensis TaxID=6573 RepID=A0A210QIE2_MIZYE|nr:paramyosin-like [Mizuhopecten yessoensis]OWF48558.1 Caprin-2 [Mizuhopecten yessoensis]